MEERAEDDGGPRGIRVHQEERRPRDPVREERTVAWVVVAISVGAFLFAAVVTVLGVLGARGG